MESLILDGLFTEILNDCSDVYEITFQEDDSWCPMRQKKETMKVSSNHVQKHFKCLHKPSSGTLANEARRKWMLLTQH